MSNRRFESPQHRPLTDFRLNVVKKLWVVIPHIVNELSQGEEKRKVALEGLRGILKLRGEEVMPLLISKLLGRRDEFEPSRLFRSKPFELQRVWMEARSGCIAF